jgi:polysaccharide export outer membrane protein
VRLRRSFRLAARPGGSEHRPAHLLLLTIALLLGAFPTQAAPREKQAPPAATAQPATDTAQPPAATAQPPDTTALDSSYFIAPGDVLKILIWKEPELSTEAFVRLDGRITVPLLGDLMAAGRTPDDLSSEIQLKLGRFLEVPQVTLSVSQAISARFYVIGEVAHPGAFPLPSRISVVQALALAGGFREFAKKESIRILRNRGGEQTAIPFNYREVEAGLRLEQNIFLEAGDSILVP